MGPTAAAAPPGLPGPALSLRPLSLRAPSPFLPFPPLASLALLALVVPHALVALVALVAPTFRPRAVAARRTPGAEPSGAQITASTAGSAASRARVAASASAGVAANGTVRRVTATPWARPQDPAVARRAVAQAEEPDGARSAGGGRRAR